MLFPVDFTFLNNEIRQICQYERKAKKVYGDEIAKNLRKRLADLEAVDSVFDLPIGNPTQLSDLVYRIFIGNEYYLIFCANNRTISKDENGNADWTRVNRIKILEIQKT